MNGMSLGGMYNVGITHLTGVTTNSAVTIINPGKNRPFYFFEIIGGHALGAMLSGLIVGPKRTRWRGRQAVVLTLESIALWMNYVVEVHYTNLEDHLKLGAFLICLACGLQNGVTSNLELITIRSTAVTGVVNDIFLSIGQAMREGLSKHSWKLILWSPTYISFWIGAVLGTLGWNALGAKASLIPAAGITLLCLVTWIITYDSYFGNQVTQTAPEMSPRGEDDTLISPSERLPATAPGPSDYALTNRHPNARDEDTVSFVVGKTV